MVRPVGAKQPLAVVYPPANHQTVADRIFLVGTAPPSGKVLVNGKPIERSRAGHFAPSFPLQVGDNTFTLQYQNQQVQLKVQRQDTTPVPPVGLAFGKDSLTPNVDIARMPGELVCFSAIAPPQSVVSVQLGKDNIRLFPQIQQVQLPANSALLTGRNQPTRQLTSGQYQGCTTLPELGNFVDGNNAISGGFTPGSGIQPQFQLTLNGQTVTQPSPGKVTILSPANLAVVEVTANEGVARTGASTDYSRLTPLPKGTRAAVTGKEGEWLRLDYGGWINSKETRIIPGAIPPRSLIRSVSARRVPGATEIVFPLQVPVPVSIKQGDRSLTLTLHNTTAQTDTIRFDDDPIISRLDWQQVTPDRLEYIFNLKSQQQWGYKLRYDGTSLILTLRHQPRTGRQVKIQNSKLQASDSQLPTPVRAGLETRPYRLPTPNSPLAGIKILLDPGHGGKETGALGPTGYPEKDINLLMSKLVREQLEKRGATVYMTRESDIDLSLPDRVTIIDKIDPAIAISLHYNALPDAGDAMKTQGLAAFWYHPQAHDLARFLHGYLVQKLNRPDYGLYWNNLALTRPASAPTILLELGFMINPYEFEWIVNLQAQQQLASAIAQGITHWFSNI
ncbi:N-acetylmuramoyl-L-alanine amidase [Scytonema millei]|nr:N-acetylmuramoyl-L-alanine amidase [Scytonema millei]